MSKTTHIYIYRNYHSYLFVCQIDFSDINLSLATQEVGLPLRPPISQEPQLTDVSLLPETPELSIAPEDNQFPQSVMEGREKVKKIVGECLLDAGIDTRLDDLIRATNPIVFGRICRYYLLIVLFWYICECQLTLHGYLQIIQEITSELTTHLVFFI